MNPQQFNMGMGRGVPNNMQQVNPAFAMNNQMVNQMGGQQGMAMQPGLGGGNLQHPQVQKYILMNLNSQGQFGGWQAGVSIQERAVQVRQLVDSLRLVRPPVEVQRALDVALQFERKAFQQNLSKDHYMRDCNEKLARIRDQRNAQMQQGMNMQGMPVQQNFGMQQMGQNMSQSMAQSMSQAQNPNLPQNNGLQQQINPQQQQQPSAFVQPGQQNMQDQSMMQHQSGENMQKATELTPEDNKAINLRAAEMASNTPKHQMKAIVDKMSPQFCENLRAKGVEPIIYYFRMQATKEFRNKRRGPDGQPQNQIPNNGFIPNQPNQTQQPQNVNDMGRYQGLQADGLRSQETGEMVVPASNNQGVMPGMMPRGNQIVNPGYADQQRRLQAQANMQRAAALRGQTQQQPQAQAGMAQQPQNVPQPNTPVQMLNRPVGQTAQGNSPQPGSRAPSRAATQQVPGQMNMQDVQKREQFLARWPVEVQNILRQKPPNEWQATLHQLNNTNNMQRSNSQQPPGMGRPQQMQNGSFVGGANMTQSLSAGAPGPQQTGQNQIQMNQAMIRQRQAMQNQQQQVQMQANQAKPPQQGQQQQPRQLNPKEIEYMDAQLIPPHILASFRRHAHVPDLKTWREFKQWAMANPNPNVPMPQVLQVQASHFMYLLRNKQQAQQAQQNAVNQVQQHQQHQHQQQQPQQQQPQQQPPMQQPQGLNMQQQQRPMNPPQIKIPTPQEVQMIRAQHPQLQHLSDDQVRQAWVNRQRQQIQKMMAQQAAQRGNMMPPVAGAQQPQPQPGPPAPQVPPQQRPPSAPNQQQRKTPVQQNKPMQAANEPAKTEPAPPNKPAQPEQQRLPIPTKEQLMAMDLQKRQQYMRMLKQQDRGRKLAELTKQVQSTAAPLRPLKLDLATRRQMQQKLASDHVKNMMGRFDQFLHAYPDLDNNEDDLRKFVQFKLELFAQYQPPSIQNKTWIPLDNFSVTSERLEMMMNELSTKFTQMHQNLSKNQQQLTPENLSRLEAQEQERKKSKGSNNAPPAPTTDRPPFQFGDTRGQGTPKYASPGVGIKQEDLKLPVDAKRRKKNSQATPTNVATPVSATPPAPSTSPQLMKQPQPPATMFRCTVPNCERQAKGFSSQAELDQHTNATHRIDINPTTDPISFLDTSLREAFNLDENYNQITKPELSATAMVKTASKGSLPPNMKIESKPGTPAPTNKPRNQMDATSYELPTNERGEVLDEWKGVNINLDEWNKVFGEWEWEDVVPAAALKLQDDFLANYQRSEEWQKMLRTPSTETTTDKSTSPPVADKEEPRAKPDHDDTHVDLEAVEGLDLSGMEDLDGAHLAPDIIMEGTSPFEVVEKPEVTGEQQFLLDHGIDYTQPDKLTDEQRQLMGFIVDPIADPEPALDDSWLDVDWDAVEKQREEDIRNQKPGTWTGHGFIPHPRKR